jgi:hypothetical protein
VSAGAAPVQLLVYAFEPGAQLEGRLVGALERLESGGAMRVLEALFIRREEQAGELTAIDVRGRGSGLTAPLLSFRLDASARRRATEKALGGALGGVQPETLRELGEALEPGAAIGAVLIEHTWAGGLADAVGQMRGHELVSKMVDATALSELDLLSATREEPR